MKILLGKIIDNGGLKKHEYSIHNINISNLISNNTVIVNGSGRYHGCKFYIKAYVCCCDDNGIPL